MPLTATDKERLTAAASRYRAAVQLFAAFGLTLDTSKLPTGGGSSSYALTPRPIPMIAPRHSTVDHGEAITLTGAQSYVRGNYLLDASELTWALEAGSAGTLVDNGLTATYTAPANGTGIAQINLTCVKDGTKVGYAFVAYPSTTYDAVVSEIVSLTGSMQQHGWKCVVRCRGGDASAFTVGKGLLLHIEDAWDLGDGNGYVASTFGGFQYPEGVLFGYITDRHAYQDGAGLSWLGLSVESPWYQLGLARMGETLWGDTADSGKLTILSFRPSDAIWHYVNELTNFTQYHDVQVFSDNNVVDDLVIEESDLATIIEDVAARTLCLAYCDRYGSLLVLPDPDVRADEYWQTEASIYEVVPTNVLNYTITETPPEVKKLLIEAIDASLLGIYAISDNTSAVTGRSERIGKLICNQAMTLASWAVQKRAQMNRPWYVDINQPLNHVLDIGDFVDVNLTSVRQTGELTASAQCWVASIAHRPDLAAGTWEGRTTLLPRTDGLGEAEVGAVSSWGGTGQYVTARPVYSGSARRGSGTGGWSGGGGGLSAFCHAFNWLSNNGDWTLYPSGAPDSGHTGQWVSGVGWSAMLYHDSDGGADNSGSRIHILRQFPARQLTGIRVYWTNHESSNASRVVGMVYRSGTGFVEMRSVTPPTGTASSLHWTGAASADYLYIYAQLEVGGYNDSAIILKSALFCGLGTDPFRRGGTGNTPIEI